MNEKPCPQCGYELPTFAEKNPHCLACGWSPANPECKVCRFSAYAALAGLGLVVVVWLLWPAIGESKVQPPRWTPAPSADMIRSIGVQALPPPPEERPDLSSTSK